MGIQAINFSTFKSASGGSGFTALIDAVGVAASVAYGLRHLRAAYAGAAVRVRRASDNAEQDIGFDGEALDWADAVSFKGASTIFVTTWYDQSGNGKHAVQATSANQPELDTTNERITFDGTNDALKTGSNVDVGGAALSILMVRQFASTSGVQVLAELGLLDQEGAAFPLVSGTFRFHIGDDATTYNRKEDSFVDTSLTLDNGQAQKANTGSAQTLLQRDNAVPGTISSPQTGNTTQNFAAAPFHIGHRDNGGATFWFNGHMKELVMFPTDLDGTQRTAAHGNINAYHTIY